MIYFLFVVLILLSAFLVLIVLLQRGRGGGLAGAFGSGGGTTSAFGTKTGDVFTWVTVVAFVLFMILSIVLFWQIKWASMPDKAPMRVSDAAERADARDSEVTERTAKLRWRDDSSNALGYRIKQSTDKNGPFTEIPDAQKIPVSQYDIIDGVKQYYYEVKNLDPGTDYYFQIGNWNKSYNDNYNREVIFHIKTKGVKPVATATSQPIGNILAPNLNPVMPETTSKPATTSAPATPASASAPAPSPAPASASAPAPAPATRP